MRKLHFGPGGWVRVTDKAGRFYVRVAPTESGELHVADLVVTDQRLLTPQGLRDVRLGWVEQQINLPEERQLIEQLSLTDPDSVGVHDRLEALFAPYDRADTPEMRRAMKTLERIRSQTRSRSKRMQLRKPKKSPY